MQNNNTNYKNDGLEILDLILLLWKRKYIILFITIICVLIGGLKFYSEPEIKQQGNYHTLINILIEDLIGEHPEIPESNGRYSKGVIVNLLNENLSSSYNYEKWSNSNDQFTDHLSQQFATVIKVSTNNHTIELNISNTKSLDAITSYLSYTTKKISDKIIRTLKAADQNDVLEIEKEIEIIEQLYQNRLFDYDSEILNQNIILSDAEKELEFLNTHIASKQSIQEPVELEVQIRQLELTNSIRVHRLIIENYKKRKGGYQTLEGELAQQVGKLTIKKEQILKRLDSSYVKDIIRLGRIKVDYSAPIVKSWKTTITISIAISLLISLIVIILREEYSRRSDANQTNEN